MNIIKKAIAYLRCSTDLQEMSIADQKKAIEAYAKKHGIVIIKYFIDEGVSGRYAEERPAFMGMMEYVKHYHDFQYVLCYDVSRWGRFIKPQEATYWEVLINKQGKDVVYVTEGFRDDGNIGDSVMKVIKNSEASEYAMKLSKTSFRGHKSWAEKGYFVGGKPKYGFDRALYDENDKFVRVLKKGECKATKTQHVKLVPNREQKRIVQKIFNMRTEERLGLRSIANKLNEIVIPSPNGGKWSSSTIWYMLGDEVYIGDIIYNKQKVDNLHEQDKKKVWGRYKPKDQWIICKGAHKPIITREQFAKVLEVNETAFRKHKQFRGTGRRHTVPYLLSGGMIKCTREGFKHDFQKYRIKGSECYFENG